MTTAAPAPETCEPTDARTETISHPAVGDEFLTIANPEHVPATDGYTETITNPDYVPGTPETTQIVNHPAVTATQWKYVKNGGQGEIWLDYNAGGKVQISGHWYQSTNKTKTITVTEAWDETVVTPGTPEQGTPTLDVWIDGTPASGDETLQVPNPDHIAAWTEYVDHEETTCPVLEEEQPVTTTPLPCAGIDPNSVFGENCWLKDPPADLGEVCAEEPTWWQCDPLLENLTGDDQSFFGDPAIELQPAPTATTVSVPSTVQHVNAADELAVTGADAGLASGLIGLLLVAAGVAAVVSSRVKRRAQR